MKKKFFAVFFAMVMVLSLAVPAFAATGAYVPSVKGTDDVKIGEAKDSSGATVSVSLTTYTDRSSLSEEAAAVMDEAYDKLTKEGIVLDLPDGVTTADLSTIAFFDISTDAEVSFPLTIKLDIDVSGMDYVQVIHYVDGKWQAEETTVNDDGTISVTVNSLSPFGVVAKVGGHTDATSPQTGVEVSVLMPVMAVCLLAGAAYCIKSAKRS